MPVMQALAFKMTPKLHKAMRKILLTLFLVLSLFYGFWGCRLLFEAHSRSVAFLTSQDLLFLAGLNLSISIFGIAPFVFLLLRKPFFHKVYWSFCLYWCVLWGWLLWPHNFSHPVEDMFGIIIMFVIPVSLGIYIQLNGRKLIES